MWYVAQVQSGRESVTRDLCLRMVSADAMQECFMPETEVQWKIRGEWRLVRRLLFPGYLFFVTDDVDELHKQLSRVPMPIRLLGNEENSFFPLTDKERDWFLSFMDCDHVVRMISRCISTPRSPTGEYADDSLFETSFDRLGFNQLTEAAGSDGVESIIVKDLARIGRNCVTMGDLVSNKFPALGIEVIETSASVCPTKKDGAKLAKKLKCAFGK